MNNETYWKIRRFLPAEFEKYSHEQLTDLILKRPDVFLSMLKGIKDNIQTAIDELVKEE